jgi:hypothetical protein
MEQWCNTQDLTNIPAGTYNVTVTDAGGCTQTLNGIVITEPAAIVLTETHVNANCNGASTGSIDLTVAGGTAPFTYAWSNGATTQDLTNITSRNYNVTVTDAGGCTQTLNGIVITEPAAIVLTETHVNANCNGASTGSIDLTVAGGTAPFTYAWSNGATTQDLTNIPAGTYNVTVTDAVDVHKP